MKMMQVPSRMRVAGTVVVAAALCLFVGVFLSRSPALRGQGQQVVWSNQEKPIADQIRGLRGLADDVRAGTTKNLAIEIRQLPVTLNKLRLANDLANLSTEGDFGRDTLQEVATTLATALHEWPLQAKQGQPPGPYVELAQLVRYEHVQATLDDPQFAAAISKIEADNERRQQADFTLTELNGKTWTLKELRGKVVLVNFWATWCPPCRKEMPDLETLYKQFKDQGLVILAISDEDEGKVKPFIAEQKVTYPILLDPERKVNELFEIEGIPKTFVYDRSGKLVAQSIDMRTRKQFLGMLAQAGLQ
jgi:peroxiredoxin